MWNRKKYFGQYFLKSKKILEGMARAAEVSKNDIILEVGPGLGSLTEILAARAKKVIAVEKDRDLISALREKLKNYKNIEIIQGDILKISNPPAGRAGFKFQISNFKIVANIPYYITSRFLRIFLSNPKLRPKLMVLMVQKEVADRILAKDKKESLLSLSVKAYAEPEFVRYVSKNFFSPPPKVDSAIIKIASFSPLRVRGGGGVTNPEQILQLAKIAFQQKRKMLRHSIKNKLSMSDIDRFGNKRPEELSLKDWAEISRYN